MKTQPYITHDSVSGFTLIEVMLTLVIAMTILGGLLLNFTSQSSQYKYQDKRVDAAQDLEFALRFIANDLQGALMLTDSLELAGSGAPSVGFGAGSDPYSTRWLSFSVWDETVGATNERARRCYVYYSGAVRYDRHDAACSAATTINMDGAIIGETVNGLKGMQVTVFRILKDVVSDPDRLLYTNIPPALPARIVRDAQNNTFSMPAYTIVVEIEVDAASRGSSVDVLGQAVANGKKRIWRYMQVYPSVVTEP